jgi:hypothetical protein
MSDVEQAGDTVQQPPPKRSFYLLWQTLIERIRSLKGATPKDRQPKDFTSKVFYKLPEPILVGDVLWFKPRLIILWRYNVRTSLWLWKIDMLPGLCSYLLILVICMAMLRLRWPKLPSAIEIITGYFRFEHVIWVGLFRLLYVVL